MDDRPTSWLRAAIRAAWHRLDVHPVEVLALVILTVGSVAALGVLWLQRTDATAPDLPGAGSGELEALASTGASEAAGSGAEGAEADGDPAVGDVVVHVTGAVTQPGLVTLDAGGRVADALDAVGGPTSDAVLDGLNLARPVTDGEQIVVPDAEAIAAGAVGGDGSDDLPPEGASPSPPATEAGRLPDGRLDLNRATAEQLTELSGIGPSLSERIVDHREANGPFAVPGDLRDVPGIGERTFQNLADDIGV